MEYNIIEAVNFEQARKELKKAKNKKNIIVSSNDEISRKILEKAEKDSVEILAIKLSGREDRLKQRDSGFNHVLARIAKKNNIKLGILLDEIIPAEKKHKAEILSRIRQNIRLCNKAKVKMKFIAINKKYKKDAYELKSLGIALGMPTWMAKEAVEK